MTGSFLTSPEMCAVVTACAVHKNSPSTTVETQPGQKNMLGGSLLNSAKDENFICINCHTVPVYCDLRLVSCHLAQDIQQHQSSHQHRIVDLLCPAWRTDEDCLFSGPVTDRKMRTPFSTSIEIKTIQGCFWEIFKHTPGSFFPCTRL